MTFAIPPPNVFIFQANLSGFPSALILPTFSVISRFGFSITTDPLFCSPKNQVIPPPLPKKSSSPPGDKEWRACRNQWDYILASKHGIAKNGRFLVRGYTEGDSSTIALAIAFFTPNRHWLKDGKIAPFDFDLLAWSCGVGVGGEYIKKII